MRFAVIGGLNLDVTGWCRGQTLIHDSNPGSISFSAGGVGRNIACGLASQGHGTELFTFVSTRPEGLMLENDCSVNRIGLTYALRDDAPVSCYMAVHGDDGDMLVGVNDMQGVKLITPQYIEKLLPVINSFDACVLDANLNAETLEYAGRNITVPIACDAVSAAKCRRLTGMLSCLSLLKLNGLEASVLTGEESCERAAEKLIEAGVKRVLISLGAGGAFAMDARHSEKILPSMIYDCQTNGAGDAMCAGAAAAMAQGLDAVQCVKHGMAESEKLLASRCNK